MRPLITASRIAESLIPLSCASDEMVWPVLGWPAPVLPSVLLSVLPLVAGAAVGADGVVAAPAESDAGGFPAFAVRTVCLASSVFLNALATGPLAPVDEPAA